MVAVLGKYNMYSITIPTVQGMAKCYTKHGELELKRCKDVVVYVNIVGTIHIYVLRPIQRELKIQRLLNLLHNVNTELFPDLTHSNAQTLYESEKVAIYKKRRRSFFVPIFCTLAQ